MSILLCVPPCLCSIEHMSNLCCHVVVNPIFLLFLFFPLSSHPCSCLCSTGHRSRGCCHAFAMSFLLRSLLCSFVFTPLMLPVQTTSTRLIAMVHVSAVCLLASGDSLMFILCSCGMFKQATCAHLPMMGCRQNRGRYSLFLDEPMMGVCT